MPRDPFLRRAWLRNGLWMALASVTVSAPAQQAPAATSAAIPTTTLQGVVVDVITHQPVARVRVEAGDAVVLTDNAGRFSFANVPVGATRLAYRRPGYFDAQSGQPEASRQVTVAAGMAEQTLPLEAAATLRGQLQLPEGDSADGMRVDLYQGHVSAGRRYWRLAQTTRARGDGAFSFSSLRPASYLVHAQASLDPTPGTGEPRKRFGYAPVFAPDTGDMSAATVFSLLPGQVAEAQLRVAHLPFYPVAVRVAGEPGRGFQVSGNGFASWPVRFDRDDDSLTTELPNGSYLLHAVGAGRQAVSGELPFHVEGAPVAGLSITVTASAAIPVEATVVADATVEGQAPHLVTLALLPVNPVDGPASTLSVETDEATDQLLLRRGVAPGRYWVTARAAGGYVAAMTSGGTDLLNQPLTVVAGSTPSLQVTLRQDTASLSVSRTGALLTSAGVIHLVPLSPDGAAQQSAGTGDPAAPVVFSALPPGDYLVLATPNQDEIAFHEPGVLAQLQGERVTLAAGAAGQATLSTLDRLPPAITGAP